MVLYVDGGCSGNGQLDLTKRRMVAVVTDHEGLVLRKMSSNGGSNNIAELWAVKLALDVAAERGETYVEVRTDSRNNLSWAIGRASYVGKGVNDRALVLRIKAEIDRLRERVPGMNLVWVPREANLAGHYIEQTQGV